MKKIVDKWKLIPKFLKVFILTMISGAIGAGILTIFGVELGTLWRNVYFAVMLILSYLFIYKPFNGEYRGL